MTEDTVGSPPRLMADRQFLRLSERWALAYDSLQWIIQKRESAKGKSENWRGVSFISSNRDILILTLREKGVVIDTGKMEEVLSLPYTFKEWIGLRQNRRAAGLRQGGVDVAAKQSRGGENTYHTARSQEGPVSNPYRVPVGPFSAFGVKAPEQPYQPEDGEDLLAIPTFLDRKAEVPLDHPLRRCREFREKAA